MLKYVYFFNLTKKIGVTRAITEKHFLIKMASIRMIMQRQSSFLVMAISLLVFVIFIMYNSKRNELKAFELISSIRKMGGGSGYDCSDSLKLKELSETLKNKMQQLGQLSCEIAKDDTSVNGGWCSRISGTGGGQHVTDAKLIPYLSKFLKGKYHFKFLPNYSSI